MTRTYTPKSLLLCAAVIALFILVRPAAAQEDEAGGQGDQYGYMVFTFSDAQGDVFRGIDPRFYLNVELFSGAHKVFGLRNINAGDFVDIYNRHTYFLCGLPAGRHNLQLRVSPAYIEVKNKAETTLKAISDGYEYTIRETDSTGEVFEYKTYITGPHVSITDMKVFVEPERVRFCHVDLSDLFVIRRRENKLLKMNDNFKWSLIKELRFRNIAKFNHWALTERKNIVELCWPPAAGDDAQ